MIKAKTKNFLFTLKKEHQYYRQNDEFQQFVKSPQRFIQKILSFLNKAMSKESPKKRQHNFFTIFSSLHSVVSWHNFENYSAVSRLSMQMNKILIFGLKRDQRYEDQIKRQAAASKLQFEMLKGQNAKQFQVLLNKILYMYVQIKQAKDFKVLSSENLTLFLQFCFLVHQKSARHSVDWNTVNQTMLDVLKYPSSISQFMFADQQVQQPLFKSMLVGKKQQDYRNKAVQFNPFKKQDDPLLVNRQLEQRNKAVYLKRQDDIYSNNQIKDLKAKIGKLESLQEKCKMLQLKLQQTQKQLRSKEQMLNSANKFIQDSQMKQDLKRYQFQRMLTIANEKVKQNSSNLSYLQKKQTYFESELQNKQQTIRFLTQENRALNQSVKDSAQLYLELQREKAERQRLQERLNEREIYQRRLEENKERAQQQRQAMDKKYQDLQQKLQNLTQQNKSIYKQLSNLKLQIFQTQFYRQKKQQLTGMNVVDILQQYNLDYQKKKKLLSKKRT